jgi:hypothetical protein
MQRHVFGSQENHVSKEGFTLSRGVESFLKITCAMISIGGVTQTAEYLSTVTYRAFGAWLGSPARMLKGHTEL